MENKNLNESIDILIEAAGDIKQVTQKFSEFDEMKNFLQEKITESNNKSDEIKEILPQIQSSIAEIKNIKEDFDQKYEELKTLLNNNAITNLLNLEKTVHTLEKQLNDLTKNPGKLNTSSAPESNEPEVDYSNYIIDDAPEFDAVGYQFIGRIESPNFVNLVSFKAPGDENWETIKKFEYEYCCKAAYVDENSYGFYKNDYPIQIECTIKRLGRPSYMNEEIIYFQVDKTMSASFLKKNIDIVRFSKESGPDILFERVKFKLKDTSTAYLPDRRWMKKNRSAENPISEEVIQHFQNFNPDTWTLCYADIKKENGKFYFTTWKSEYNGNIYFITVGNQVITNIVNEKDFVEVINNDESLYNFVKSVNEKLMKEDSN